jgi:hypothetical protein
LRLKVGREVRSLEEKLKDWKRLEEKLKVGRKEKDLDLVIEKRREELDLSRFILKVREVEKRS